MIYQALIGDGNCIKDTAIELAQGILPEKCCWAIYNAWKYGVWCPIKTAETLPDWAARLVKDYTEPLNETKFDRAMRLAKKGGLEAGWIELISKVWDGNFAPGIHGFQVSSNRSWKEIPKKIYDWKPIRVSNVPIRRAHGPEQASL